LLSETTLEAFHDSYERVKENPEFFDVFYERFISSSDEVAGFFENVDLSRTKKMVKDALIYKLIAADGSGFGRNKLEKLAASHIGYGVKDRHYEVWLEALMSVVEEMDPKYNFDIDSAWREVMKIGIDIMTSSRDV
jgi:hemoglobin-like flavoprotein